MAGAAKDEPVPLKGAALVANCAEPGDADAVSATSETTAAKTAVSFPLLHTRLSLVARLLTSYIRGNSLVVLVRVDGASIVCFRSTVMRSLPQPKIRTFSMGPSIAWGLGSSSQSGGPSGKGR